MANHEETRKKPYNDDQMVEESSSIIMMIRWCKVIPRKDDSRTEESESNSMYSSEETTGTQDGREVSQPDQAVGKRFSFLDVYRVTDEDDETFITYEKCLQEGFRRMEAEMNKCDPFVRKGVDELAAHSCSDANRLAVAVEEVAQLESKLRCLKEENARLIKVRDRLITEWRKVREVRKAGQELESRVEQLRSVLERSCEKNEELENDISGLMKARDEGIEELRKRQMEVKRLEDELRMKKVILNELIEKMLKLSGAAILIWLIFIFLTELLF